MANRRKPVCWNGKHYAAQIELIAILRDRWNVSTETVRLWLRRGLRCDDDVRRMRANLRRPRRACEWNDNVYPSIQAAADAECLTHGAMSYRINRGYRRDEDMAW